MTAPSRKRMSRGLRGWGAGLVAAGAMLVASFAPLKAEPVTLRIGYDVIPIHIIPVIFRMPQFLKHYGKSYTIKFYRFKGSPLQVQALAADQIDIAALAFSTFATSISNAHLPIKGIADLAQDGPWYSQNFGVLKDSPIKTVKDLKGKVLAVNAFGGATDMAVRTILVKNGLTPDKDARIIEGSFGAMAAMVRGHKIDVGAFPAPFWAAAEKRGDLRSLFTSADALGVQQFLLYAAKADFIKTHHDVLVDYYEDYLRGLKAVVDPANREAVLKVMAEASGAPMARFKDWALLKGKDYYHDPNGRINVKALQNNIDSLHDLGLLKQTLDVAPYIDNSLVDEARKRM